MEGTGESERKKRPQQSSATQSIYFSPAVCSRMVLFKTRGLRVALTQTVQNTVCPGVHQVIEQSRERLTPCKRHLCLGPERRLMDTYIDQWFVDRLTYEIRVFVFVSLFSNLN